MFEQGLEFVLKAEGGYSNNPNDSGGATDHGITQHTYNHWRQSKGLQTEDVENITDEEVSSIYKEYYWDANKCDALPSKLAIAVFDWAVNAGNYAAIYLQGLLGVSQDGQIGPQTIQAVSFHNESELLASYLTTREEYYRKLAEHNIKDRGFLKGWLARVNNLRTYLDTL